MRFYKDIINIGNDKTCPICGGTVRKERAKPTLVSWGYFVEMVLEGGIIACVAALLLYQITNSLHSLALTNCIPFAAFLIGVIGTHLISMRRLKVLFRDSGFVLKGAIYCNNCDNRHLLATPIHEAAVSTTKTMEAVHE